MLLQRLNHHSSVKEGFCRASDIGAIDSLFNLMPATETCQMKSNPEMDKNFGHGTANNGPKKGDMGFSMSHIQSCNTSESSALNIVYQRKKFLKDPMPQFWPIVSAKTSPDTINFVYERRKHQKSGVTNFLGLVSANSSRNGACSSSIRSENPTNASLEKIKGSHELDAGRLSSLSESEKVSDKEMCLSIFGANIGCPLVNQVCTSKDKKNKTVQMYSVDDSCSSSMLNMDGDVVPSNTEIDDADECSSSGAHVTDSVSDDLSLSVKALCVSILHSHSLLNRCGQPDENDPPCSSSNCSRSCNVCGLPETAVEMLICDECEEAFHLSCFNPSIKKIPIDEWYCQSCAKKKHNFTKERAMTKSSIIGSGKGSMTSARQSSPIELMLQDTEPYITSVRVGKGFQALVPEWRGPMTKGLDIPKLTELEPPFGVNLCQLNHGKPHKSGFIGNWLQCRDVIIGMGDDVDGTICGKWRRAPLFEPQTDKWDCFRSVLWDPTYADCAVPQELETEEVLKQLKYLDILKPRLTAKRRKLEMCSVSGGNGCQATPEDASIETA